MPRKADKGADADAGGAQAVCAAEIRQVYDEAGLADICAG
jgi:hypothetical protein